jgi:hypothetical protein
MIGRTYIENKSVFELSRPVLNEKLKQQRGCGFSTFVQYRYGWKSWNGPVVASGIATAVSGACRWNELYSEASGL